MDKILSVILARKESKRIPGKNTLEFMGHPFIKYPLATLEMWGRSDVIVSTDDPKVVEILKDFDGRMCDRNPENAEDSATMYDGLMEVIDEVGGGYKYYFLVYACNPFTTVLDLENAYKGLFHGYDMVTTIQKSENIRHLFRGDGKPLFPVADDETTYTNPGQFFAGRISELKKQGTIFVENSTAIFKHWNEGQDINYPEDIIKAKLKISYGKGS